MNRGAFRQKERLLGLLLILPALTIFLTITYYPLIFSFFYSVTDFTGRSLDFNFVGLENFRNAMNDSLVRASIWNTFSFALFTTLIGNSVNLLLALVLDSGLRTKNYLRTAFYIPCLLSPVIVSAIFGSILQYDGVLNTFLKTIGLDFLALDYFGKMNLAMPMLMALNIWQWCGYGAIIYLAGLQTIPTEYYEAATIDGAGAFDKFFKITLPLLMPSITIVTFMSLTGGLKLFDLPFILTKGGPGNATQTIGTAIYKIGFEYNKMGYATAIAVLFFFVIAILAIAQLRLTRSREVEH